MEKVAIRLVAMAQRVRALDLLSRAPLGWVMTLSPPTRTNMQNAKLWAMIADCQAQIPDMQGMDGEDIKLRFMDALGVEMRYIPKLDSEGFFPVGHRSSQLSKQRFADLIELIYAHGSAHGVKWSEPHGYE